MSQVCERSMNLQLWLNDESLQVQNFINELDFPCPQVTA